MAISEAPQVRWNDKRLVLDPSKPRGPQIAAIAAQLFGMFGGLVFGLVGMLCYPLLIPDRVLAFGGLASMLFWAAASFIVIRGNYFPKDMPGSARVMVRFGVALCTTAWTIGF